MKLKLVSIGIVIGLTLTTAILTLSSFNGQDNANRYLNMKVFEYFNIKDPKIIIVYETGQVEEIPLKDIKESHYVSNMQKVNETINLLNKKGYRIVSSYGDAVSGSYVFEKK